MQLRILNLSRAITEQELGQLFQEFGNVTECTIVKDDQTGKSKGFGFITLESEESAMRAMEALHKKKIKGERLRVKLADGE